MNFNTDRYRAFTLIHEFAHELGVPGFVPEGGNPFQDMHSLEKANNNLILNNCGKTLDKFDNGMI